MRPDNVGLGGFDSHAFPPRARTRISRGRAIPLSLYPAIPLLFAAIAAFTPVDVRAQVVPPATPPATSAQSGPRVSIKPPISPGRAFIASAILPGVGQSALGRGTGALFVVAEAVGLTMYGKARRDLSIARAYTRDSTPLTYVVDPTTGLPVLDATTGELKVASWSSNHYAIDRVRARKTHAEDWAAFLIFNHLFAAVDALVAAQLWELPAQVEFRASPRSMSVRAGFHW